ncbi:hypothetical protein [uncultured Desulfosarcina sp.]|uniref:hypothetical protein n=1 Tax=uncultured Desulfosarcina sp. TaxID=218289 RepID=UPI0029C6A4C3|nr:hypothetical protein [uncultured Desulfosarcina sp.]
MSGMFLRLIQFKFRKRRRHKAQAGLFVTFDNTFSINQIGDINMGGLSYYYEDPGFTMGMRAHSLRIVTADDPTGINHIPFRIVSDRETGSLLFKNRRINRQGIQFSGLTLVQKRKLRDIIQNYTHKPTDSKNNASLPVFPTHL